MSPLPLRSSLLGVYVSAATLFACADEGPRGEDEDTLAPEVSDTSPTDVEVDTTAPLDTAGPPYIVPPPLILDGPYFTLETYPRVDGSTSTEPLARVIACELLGVPYAWMPGYGTEGELEIVPVARTGYEEVLADGIMERVVHHKTEAAFRKLINADADLILVANPASDSILEEANLLGVTLVEEAVALDAYAAKSPEVPGQRRAVTHSWCAY